MLGVGSLGLRICSGGTRSGIIGVKGIYGISGISSGSGSVSDALDEYFVDSLGIERGGGSLSSGSFGPTGFGSI